RVRRPALVGEVRIGRALVVRAAVGDRVVLEAGEDPDPPLEVRADVIHRQVEPDVAVEIAVDRVARVSLLRAPDLLRALDVAPEGGDAGGAVDRRVDAEDGAWIGEEDTVRVDEEVTNPFFAKQL